MVWLIPIGVGVAAGSAYAWWQLRRRDYRIAVLGARESGKTTLINSWRGKWADGAYQPTQASELIEKQKYTAEGFRLRFLDLEDMSGDLDGWPNWENRAKESRYVLYLVDARALAGQFARNYRKNWRRLEDDAGLIADWMEQGKAELCLMVVTHTDQDPRLRKLGQNAYQEAIVSQLDPLMLKIGGPRTVHIVVGSLKTLPAAQKLTSLIMERIISYEKGKK